MGWFSSDRPGHEGYVVAFVAKEGSSLLRELGYPDKDVIEAPANANDLRASIAAGAQRIQFVAVACDCGWRSPRLVAPYRTSYYPHCVELNDELAENGAQLIWSEHIYGDGADRKTLPRCSVAVLTERLTTLIKTGRLP